MQLEADDKREACFMLAADSVFVCRLPLGSERAWTGRAGLTAAPTKLAFHSLLYVRTRSSRAVISDRSAAPL